MRQRKSGSFLPLCVTRNCSVAAKLLSVAPAAHLALFVEINDAHSGTVSKVKRDERLSHVQVVNPCFALAAHLNVVRLAVGRDDLILCPPDFGVLFVGLRGRSGLGIGVITGATRYE